MNTVAQACEKVCATLKLWSARGKVCHAFVAKNSYERGEVTRKTEDEMNDVA